MKSLIYIGLIVATLLSLLPAQATLRTSNIVYRQGDALLEGYLAYDDSIPGKRPGVLVVHEWTGLGPYTKMRAEQLAKLGYVAFAADIYGKGVRPQNPAEAGKTAALYRNDRALTRSRIQAALELLRGQKQVDPDKIAAIGYCFGGMVALELARSGSDINGVVSFHGSLDTPNPADAKNIKCKVLVLHGGDDPNVTPEQVLAFWQAMRQAGVNWQINVYGGAVHSFTNPASGNDPSKGAAYNSQADKRSWRAMQDFFDEIFNFPQNK